MLTPNLVFKEKNRDINRVSIDANINDELEDINKANYSSLLNWLRENIHQHGRRYLRNELLERSTGETLNAKPYISYLKDKASQVYGVKF